MEQFVGSNYPVFISKHIQESSTETSDYKDGVLHGLMSDFPYGRILLVAETGATAPGELSYGVKHFQRKTHASARKSFIIIILQSEFCRDVASTDRQVSSRCLQSTSLG